MLAGHDEGLRRQRERLMSAYKRSPVGRKNAIGISRFRRQLPMLDEHGGLMGLHLNTRLPKAQLDFAVAFDDSRLVSAIPEHGARSRLT